ncbi:MAG: hypothetical protein JW928_06015 [Candidatus Aureabacteria bacterium]|nr:hypothetical protein [Candidatus Auribacterota bacterium]
MTEKIQKAAKACLFLFLITPFALSLFLRVEYYDSFDYLRNALAMIQKNSSPEGYVAFRPALLPVLEIPLLFLFTPPEQTKALMTSVHLLGAFIALLTSLSVFFIFKKHVGQKKSFLIMLVFVSNALFVHYAPFGMADILATLCLSWAIFFTWKAGESSNFFYVLTIFFFFLLASACKFYLAFIGILYSFFLCFYLKKIPSWKIMINSIFLLIFFFTIHLYPLYHIGSANACSGFFQALTGQVGYSVSSLKEAPTEYFYAALFSMKLPASLFVLAGLLCRIVRRRKKDYPLFFLLMLLLLFILSYKHKESRYLMPLLPLLSYFSVRGLYGMISFSRLMLKEKNSVRFIKAALFLMLTMSCLYSWSSENIKFFDPVFYYPLQENLARKAAFRNPEQQRMFWFNFFYTISPKNRKDLLLHSGDEFMYRFHTSANAMYVLSGIPCRFVNEELFPGTFLPKNISLIVPDKTLAFFSPYEDYYKDEKTHDISLLKPVLGQFEYKIFSFSIPENPDDLLQDNGHLFFRSAGGDLMISLGKQHEQARVLLKSKDKISVLFLHRNKWNALPGWIKDERRNLFAEILFFKNIPYGDQ